jgi:hypothetical protein
MFLQAACLGEVGKTAGLLQSRETAQNFVKAGVVSPPRRRGRAEFRGGMRKRDFFFSLFSLFILCETPRALCASAVRQVFKHSYLATLQKPWGKQRGIWRNSARKNAQMSG